MAQRRLMACVALVVLVAVTACASDAAPTASAEMCSPGEICKNGYTNYYWTLEDRFEGNESFRVFCGPVGRAGCDGGWKPVSVTMYLYWEEANSCALTVQAEIHEAATSEPRGPDAGRLVASSLTTEVGPFSPAGLWAITVAMPTDSPAITGPCFASIRFLDACDELPAMVAAPGSCEPSKSWNDRGDGWVDMLDLELPGNLSAYASFECQRASTEESVAWSTIKSMYGTEE